MSFCSIMRCQSVSFGKKADLTGKEAHDRICILAHGFFGKLSAAQPHQITYQRQKGFSKLTTDNSTHLQLKLYHHKLWSLGPSTRSTRPALCPPKQEATGYTNASCAPLLEWSLEHIRQSRSATLRVLRTCEKASPLSCREKRDPPGSAAVSWGSFSRKDNLAEPRLRAVGNLES